jgi:16S rRNA (adenine1518-N6/adenine1519-N6)-dimethyltransferase
VDNQIFKKIQSKKELGQNFLLSKKALEEIVQSAELSLNDIVLEIGAGTGILTEELAIKAKRVIAIEKDKRLISILRERFEKYQNVEILSGDVRNIIRSGKGRKTDNFPVPRPYKVVANLPYYLSSYIIRRFLEIENKPKIMILMLQKELAERICAKAGKMSLISAMVNFYGKPELGSIIKKDNFYPQPKVDSRILTIRNIKEPCGIDIKIFFRILKIGFSSKRKMLIGNLKNGLGIPKEQIKKMFDDLGINKKARAQELTLKNWKELTEVIRTYNIKN